MVAAMLKLANNKRLKQLGWRQLLQIHDELIFEV
jgi:DNA polymerase I-like protein with 3'-5' exonuclease and polymerase domains